MATALKHKDSPNAPHSQQVQNPHLFKIFLIPSHSANDKPILKMYFCNEEILYTVLLESTLKHFFSKSVKT